MSQDVSKLPKKLIPYLISIVTLFIFSVVLFLPQIEKKVIPAGDLISSYARTKHKKDYKAETGNNSYWNSAEFSGNPISLLHLGSESNYLRYITDVLTFKVDKPIGMFFMIGVIMFISLCLLGVNPWLGLIISMAYMLSTYYFHLLEAGHAKKINTVAYFPFILAGVILAFQKKYIKGFIPVLIGTSLAIYHSHVQMVLYLFILLIVLTIPFIIDAFRRKEITALGKGIAFLLIAAVLGSLTNFAQLKSSQDFSKSTMRGEAILEKQNENELAKSSSEVDGLEWSYAMSWSNEIGDFLGILVPRIVGGGSQEKVEKDNAIAKLILQSGGKKDKNGKVSIPGYFSTMLFASGPSYIGASLLVIFLLALIAFWKEPWAQGAAIAVVFLFFLSLGENAEWFNRIFFENFPLFNKFRAPSSIMVILPIFVSIASAIGLNKIFETKDRSIYLKPVLAAGGSLALVTLVIILFGGAFFDYITQNELAQYKDSFQVQNLLKEGRQAMQRADAVRSLLLIAAVTGVLLLLIKDKLPKQFIAVAIIGVIFLGDILPINRRYLSEDDYISKALYDQQFRPRKVDNEIAKLNEPSRGHYRVFDGSVNTFNDAKSCAFHNQIGGYNPAKLQRYQDLIDWHISKNNMEVFNMLNAKYFIRKDQSFQVNPGANGPVWFVEKTNYVSTPQEEIDALKDFNSKQTAIINQSEFGNTVSTGLGKGSISLVKYFPDRLEYKSQSSSQELAVFSEIWYGGDPDWIATIDGEPVDFIRANYVLRALEIPAGQHDIVFEFKPKAKGAIISSLSSIFSIILILLAMGYGIRAITNDEVPQEQID